MTRNAARSRSLQVTNFSRSSSSTRSIEMLRSSFLTEIVVASTLSSKLSSRKPRFYKERKNRISRKIRKSPVSCPRRDSNPHIFKGQWILSPSRLPFRHSGRGRDCKDTHFLRFYKRDRCLCSLRSSYRTRDGRRISHSPVIVSRPFRGSIS